jgi:hypothetical protein
VLPVVIGLLSLAAEEAVPFLGVYTLPVKLVTETGESVGLGVSSIRSVAGLNLNPRGSLNSPLMVQFLNRTVPIVSVPMFDQS